MDEPTQQQATFPVFSLSRAYLLGRGFPPEIVKGFSDQEMQRIAELVGNGLLSVFNVCVDFATQAVLAERDSELMEGEES